jgi:hypothetical protein
MSGRRTDDERKEGKRDVPLKNENHFLTKYFKKPLQRLSKHYTMSFMNLDHCYRADYYESTSFIFEAAEAEVKIGSSLKLNHHCQI